MTQNKSHQEIGKEQELFFTDEISPGTVFWMPKGMVIFKELERYIRELTEKAGYQETTTPIMVKTKLFKQSGHWDKFGSGAGNDMYNLSSNEPEEIEFVSKYLERPDVNKEIQKALKCNNYQKISFPVLLSEKPDDWTTATIASDSTATGFGWSLDVNHTLKPMNCP